MPLRSFITALVLASGVLVMACGRTHGRVDPPRRDAATRDAATRDAGEPGPVSCDREVEVVFTPTARAQLAVWVEGDGRFETLALTDATAVRGIGNRPGALQMNSGYRWPVGRRENVLPGWAGARLAAGGARFRRVVFQARREGFASRAGSSGTTPQTRDDYFCLPFHGPDSGRDRLDAVTCASGPLYMDKGRYFDDADIARGYAEPEESSPGVGGMRPLDASSAYPPRRDLTLDPDNHPDAAGFADDALRAMPELDAVTMATPRGDTPVSLTWPVPDAWSGELTLSIELNTEGDYGPAHDPSSLPTPVAPEGEWDSWSRSYGYPYRGQPSVLYESVLRLPPTDRRVTEAEVTMSTPTRMGTLDGSLETAPIDDSIVDDPIAHPGSGADRARRIDGTRIRAVVRQVRCR